MTEERPTKLIVNCETGEQTIEPMSDEEWDQLKASSAEIAKVQAAEEAERLAKAEAKASALAKLAALGLTEEEAAAIAG